MYQKNVSMDRLNDKENKRKSLNASPYALNYRSNLTHDQRALISHRNFVSKLQRGDLEDRYLNLLDEHFALKKENLINHDKIRRLVTKILRLSGDAHNRIQSARSKQNLSIDEDMQIRIIDLESHNTQLKEQLNVFSRTRISSRSRCASAATMRAASSTPSLMRSKSKRYQSDDNFACHMQQPFSKEDRILTSNAINSNVSNRNRNRNERNDDEQDHRNSLDCPSTAVEDVRAYSIEPSDLNEREEEIKELKDLIEKLQQELDDRKLACERKACKANDTDNSNEIELVVIREKLLLSQQAIQQQETHFKLELAKLQSQNQLELDSERVKMYELKELIENEVRKNKVLLKEKETAEADLKSVNITKQETCDIQAENELLKKHRENIALLAAELAARTDRIKELRRDNTEIRTDLVEAQTSISTLQNCHTDMMHKIQSLQDANDRLTVQMEGIRAQCQCLTDFSSLLEAPLQIQVTDVIVA